MGYTQYPPHPALERWVRCFWSIADTPSDEIQDVWPDGCLELIFSPGNILQVNADGSSERLPPAVVIGLQTRIMRVRAEGEVRLLSARLLPTGLRLWSAAELEPVLTQIELLLPSARFSEAVGILQTWLLSQPKVNDSLAGIIQKFYASGGNLSVAELAATQGVSSRHLQRTFAARLGIAPKALAKVVRFAQSWSMLLKRPELTVAELALELGFSDQAHFSNEFRSFSQQSPRAFRKSWDVR